MVLDERRVGLYLESLDMFATEEKLCALICLIWFCFHFAPDADLGDPPGTQLVKVTDTETKDDDDDNDVDGTLYCLRGPEVGLYPSPVISIKQHLGYLCVVHYLVLIYRWCIVMFRYSMCLSYNVSPNIVLKKIPWYLCRSGTWLFMCD